MARPEGLLARAPTFCAGCPHATSTKVPEGSKATAGIGCHIMALEHGPMTPRTFSQMGGEGAHWAGLSSFMDMKHSFANMGDGTYQHSGLLAIRQAVAAKTPITYKILYNDAVAMTGGQPAEGSPVRRADRPASGRRGRAVDRRRRGRPGPPARRSSDLPPDTARHGREELGRCPALDARIWHGVSVLIYDQVCATEKRRRRKRGKMAAAETTVQINQRVCENCGDCTVQSNCIAIEPVDDTVRPQAPDFADGVQHGSVVPKGVLSQLRYHQGSAAAPPPADVWGPREAEFAATPYRARSLPHPASTWRGLFAGIGGGGIVTTGAIVAMAAHLDGLQVSTLDFTGLAQKNGAVVAHVQIGAVSAGRGAHPGGRGGFHARGGHGRGVRAPGCWNAAGQGTTVMGNLDLQASVAFLRERDLRIDAGLHRRVIERVAGPGRWLRAAAICEKLFGNAQAMNTLLLGPGVAAGRAAGERGGAAAGHRAEWHGG